MTCGTRRHRWRSSGASVKGVQRMLGHQDAAMTLNMYASLFEDDLDAVSERLDAAIAKASVSSVCPEGYAVVCRLIQSEDKKAL
jgi:hypothetical protein